MSGKVIVTNVGALRAKYKAAGLAKLKAAVAALAAADKARGISTGLIALDSASAMTKFGVPAVEQPSDQRAAKRAIDAICRALQPDYLLLLGATDIIPHQDLVNPVFSPGDDDDRLVPSDLPYACDAAFGTHIPTFLGPTRVVGRLPNITGDTDPTYLVGVLKSAAKASPKPYSAYANYFGLSAEPWQGSTSLSLENVFGDSTALLLCPPSGPKWTAPELRALSHYINCHGGQADPQFYGQHKKQYPIAHLSTWLTGKILPGTIASAECCYGAELYDAPALGLPTPICNEYLKAGAYGYFGSTTIAYGPADGNDQADIICQIFLLRALSGSSLGRATLEARQALVNGAAQLDPVNLKTLAQFNLLGDPSIHAVSAPSPDALSTHEAKTLARTERRAELRAMGEFLVSTKRAVGRGSSTGVTPAQRRAMVALASRDAIEPTALRAFSLPRPRRRPAGKAVATPDGYLLLHGTAGADPRSRACIVAKLVGGRVVAARTYHRR